MKKLLFIFALLIGFCGCQKDPLNNNPNPTPCPTGYTGTNCDQEKTPTRMYITGIRVTWFPNTDPSGYTWDVGFNTNADIYVDLTSSTTTLFSSSVRSNVSNNSSNYFSCNVEVNPNSNYWVDLYDYDSGTSSDFIASYAFKPYTSGQGFPTTLYFYKAKMNFEVNVSYVH